MKKLLSQALIINITLFLSTCNKNTKEVNKIDKPIVKKIKTQETKTTKTTPRTYSVGSSSKSSIVSSSIVKQNHLKWLSDKLLKDELKTFSQYNNLYKKWIKSSDGKDALQKAYEDSDDFITNFNAWKATASGDQRSVDDFKTQVYDSNTIAHSIYQTWVKTNQGKEKIEETFSNDIFNDKLENFKKLPQHWKKVDEYVESQDVLDKYNAWRESDEGKEVLKTVFQVAGDNNDEVYNDKYDKWTVGKAQTSRDLYENSDQFKTDAIA